ncbi:hypothetical protein EGR_07222 [Echinococcus granulosus]|uniref:Uncharacterized protein n=1 Tax=Echinococcus granulosus TaxID=6210 RepID=W6UIM3_ECHGR|nr:hypothetical protein EGR_07222 [Echinococcus granulosus]EUB57952.1 hypothetical protein EGR_07222 [Echinococcus granulosus]
MSPLFVQEYCDCQAKNRKIETAASLGTKGSSPSRPKCLCLSLQTLKSSREEFFQAALESSLLLKRRKVEKSWYNVSVSNKEKICPRDAFYTSGMPVRVFCVPIYLDFTSKQNSTRKGKDRMKIGFRPNAPESRILYSLQHSITIQTMFTAATLLFANLFKLKHPSNMDEITGNVCPQQDFLNLNLSTGKANIPTVPLTCQQKKTCCFYEYLHIPNVKIYILGLRKAKDHVNA